MNSNKLSKSLLLCLLVILFLFLLSIIPEFGLQHWTFKRIDPVADVRQTPAPKVITAIDTVTVADTIQTKIDSVAETVKLGCPEGITCIEDYSGDSTAMLRFIKALRQLKGSNRTVHIAMYGDSFIEGDVLCGSFRDTLQSLFGGSGVGYMPITSSVTGFRRTIRHQFENWNTYSIINKDSTGETTLGPAGYCFIPLADNWVAYKPPRYRRAKPFKKIRLYYRNFGQATVDYVINDTLNLMEDLPITTEKLDEWTYAGGPVRSIKFQFTRFDRLEVYGASFEDQRGIYVDNFSMRGNSGVALDQIPDEMISTLNKFKRYKLVILQYGLNVLNEDSSRYKWYTDRMINVVKKMKRDFPDASILLLSVSDRSTNTSGEFKTLKMIPAMRNAQRYIARQTGIAFWDMYAAMGGENSMVKFVESNPALAAKDYTHLTFKGGKKLAQALVNSLMYERERYKKK